MTKRIAACALITLLFLGTAFAHHRILAMQAGAKQEDTTNLERIPASFAGYTQLGSDRDIAEDVKQALQTSTILTRNYRAPGGRVVQLTVVHAGKTRRSLHFPEVCLVGQGWEIMEQYAAPVGLAFTARRLVIANGNTQQAVLYWFKTRDKYTGNFFLNSWYWAYEQLTLGVPTSTMIRLSTYVIGGDSESAFGTLEDMALKLAPKLLETID